MSTVNPIKHSTVIHMLVEQYFICSTLIRATQSSFRQYSVLSTQYLHRRGVKQSCENLCLNNAIKKTHWGAARWRSGRCSCLTAWSQRVLLSPDHRCEGLLVPNVTRGWTPEPSRVLSLLDLSRKRIKLHSSGSQGQGRDTQTQQ